jgi:hypothetical protein
MNVQYLQDIILFDEAFKYGDGAKYWCYVGTNTEPPCVEVFNFVQCCILMNYLTFCLSVSLSICMSSRTYATLNLPMQSTVFRSLVSVVKEWKESRLISSFQNYSLLNASFFELYILA